MCNVGVSSSPAQTGDYEDTYFIHFNHANGIVGGRLYLSAMNGWRGILIDGNQSSIKFSGAVVEGYKPGGPEATTEPDQAHRAARRSRTTATPTGPGSTSARR